MSAKSVTADHADPSVIMSNHPAVTVHGINMSIPPQCPYEPSLDPLLFFLVFYWNVLSLKAQSVTLLTRGSSAVNGCRQNESPNS